MGVQVMLNSMGHRSKEIRFPKLPNEKRIMAVGSSVTMGWGVPQDEVFTALVESRLNQDRKESGTTYTAINAGVANFNTVHQAALFKQQADRVQPDLLVINYFMTDADPIPQQKDSPLLRLSLFFGFLYQKWQGLSASPTGKSPGDHYRELYTDGNPDWEMSKQGIRQMKELCERGKTKMVVLITPNPHDLAKDSPYPAIYEKIAATFQGMDIDVINTYPAFFEKYGQNPSQLWVAVGDPHPNANGHRLMADELFKYLANHPI
jgi:lysophospholipase L1-like esterase